MTLVMYSKDGCPFCSLLKAELRRRGVAVTVFDLTDDAVRAEFYSNTGTKTVPQLYLDEAGASTSVAPHGESLGGWSDISRDWSVVAKTT